MASLLFKLLKQRHRCSKLTNRCLHEFSTSSTTTTQQFRRMFDKTKFSDYHEFYSTFKWKIPQQFNIGYECSDYHVDIGNGNNVALMDHTSNTNYTFNDISILSNKLCNSLT
eukprot:873248_1